MNLALDIGATNTRIALVEKTNIKQRIKTFTPRKRSEIIKRIIELIQNYKDYSSICISIAGVEIKGRIQNALNMDINNVPLGRILKSKFKRNIYLENDARCAGIAELTYGAGKIFNNFILLTLGTGIGGAIFVNGKLYRGTGAAGEIGSMFIDNKIFEHLASGNASLVLAKHSGLINISSKDLEDLAKKGNKKVLKNYNKIGHFLGIGLANLAYIFSPEVFIIGGGFSKVKYIYPEAIKTLKELYKLNPKPKIIKAKFGDDAGLIGAAFLPKYKY